MRLTCATCDGINCQCRGTGTFSEDKMEPLHPTKQDNMLSEIEHIGGRLSILEEKMEEVLDRLDSTALALPVEYADKPDTVQVLGPSGYITRKGTVISASVVMTQAGPDIVFVIKGEDGRIAGISASGVKFL